MFSLGMKKIVLISCVSKKLPHKSKARDLYVSPLFKKGLKYAEKHNPDKIFVLSAKYGLLDLEEEIEDYNETLNEKNQEELKVWAGGVLEKLKEVADVDNDEIIFLAGENYRKFLIPHLANYKIPMQGLGIGRQLQFLTKENESKNICEELHNLFNNMKRFSFPFNAEEIPLNGIYILFEKGETAHGAERIVRIGTHTGQNNLRSRLKEHFINEVKDRSIFRKNIGRCLLKGDCFLSDWELTPLIREVREKNPQIDFIKQEEIEKQVSQVIRNKFSFIVIPVEEKEERLQLESKIISTVSLCKDCKPSESWLGFDSPKEKIKESGLWLVNELYKEPLAIGDLEKIKSLISLGNS
jgi:hypothetical protein